MSERKPPTTILCFDRDRTVDTNPPQEDLRAVPLAWVKYLAHEPSDAAGERIDVWATGNQVLTAEAALPGTVTAQTVRQQLIDELYHDRGELPDDPPALRSREGRIRIIAGIYRTVHTSCDFEFIVVDDIDLSGLQRYDIHHYYPWEFVESVEENGVPVSIPSDTNGYTNEPVFDDRSLFTTVSATDGSSEGMTDDPTAPLLPSFHDLLGAARDGKK